MGILTGQTEFKLRTREKVHKCKFCCKAFANEGSMQNHVVRCHEDEEEDAEVGGWQGG